MKNGSTVRMKVSDLQIHPTAQREIVPSNLARIKANMDIDAIGTVYAVRRAGLICVIDGQHRVLALIQNGLGDLEIDIHVYENVADDAAAAALFLKLNKKATVAPFDKFMASLTARDPETLNAKAIVDGKGLRLSRNSSTSGSLTCVSSLMSAYRVDHGLSLSRALDVCIHSWGRGATSLEGKLIEGIARLLAKHKDIDPNNLIKKLQKHPAGAAGVISDASGIRKFSKMTMPAAVAEVVIGAYNSGKQAAGRIQTA